MGSHSRALGAPSAAFMPWPNRHWPPSLLVQGLTCSFLARERQVVVAGDVVPFALLVPDHHNAVLTRGEEVIGLVGPPVLKLLGREESLLPGAKPSLFSRCLSSPPLCLLPFIRRNHGLPTPLLQRLFLPPWGPACGSVSREAWKCQGNPAPVPPGPPQGLTSECPSDQRKSFSTALSLSPIHW